MALVRETLCFRGEHRAEDQWFGTALAEPAPLSTFEVRLPWQNC